ncbi:MAG TPA: MerR family DNA-binding transcriptional regulator [Syntrophales bacterium]|nr:MerR family DNA-binding transcriptional regulator [Syntrophales bacterium]
MIIVKGKTHYTIVDAAEQLGVSAKTIRDYIQRGIIPEPPEIKYGVRILKHFPADYIDAAKTHLDNYRNTKYDKRR